MQLCLETKCKKCCAVGRWSCIIMLGGGVERVHTAAEDKGEHADRGGRLRLLQATKARAKDVPDALTDEAHQQHAEPVGDEPARLHHDWH